MSSNVAPVTTPSNVAPVAAFSDVTLVTAPIAFSFALPPPVLVLLAFPSSPQALSASAPRSLNTPACAVVPAVALKDICNRLTPRNAEYTKVEDRFVAREADAECLKAEVQSLIEQATVLRDEDAQRQQLLGSCANGITSLKRELADVCAQLLVSADALAARTHECDQLRQSVERFCLYNEQYLRLLGTFSQQIETLDRNLGRAAAELKSSQSTLRRGVAPLLED